jgi:hypothetical protein
LGGSGLEERMWLLEGVSYKWQPLRLIMKVIVNGGWVVILEVRPNVFVVKYQVNLSIGKGAWESPGDLLACLRIDKVIVWK